MTSSTLYDSKVGDKLPEVKFGPISRATLALYAGASGDHNAVHIDSDAAKAAGMPDVFAQGMLSYGVLTRVITGWAGMERLRSFGARFVSMTHVHDVVVCTGEITEILQDGGDRVAQILLTASTPDGRKTLTGEATVVIGEAGADFTP